MTSGQWPWKLESAKECVATHQSNHTLEKMEGKEVACDPHEAFVW